MQLPSKGRPWADLKAELEAAGHDFAKRMEITKPLREERMKEIGAVLTDEQKAEMRKHFAGKGDHGGHGKKHEKQ